MTALTATPRRRTRPRIADHGTQREYDHGCRCHECRAAHAAYRRETRRQARERGGEAISDMTPETREKLFARVMRHVRIDESGCWLWTKNVNGGGYGQIVLAGRSPVVHRVVYQILVGPIPVGLELDHMCHNRDPDCFADKQCIHRRCVNPDHLKPSTPRENVLRGKTPAARNAAKTHCVNGHALTPDNVYTKSNGCRGCRACQRLARARWAKKNPEKERARYTRSNQARAQAKREAAA